MKAVRQIAKVAVQATLATSMLLTAAIAQAHPEITATEKMPVAGLYEIKFNQAADVLYVAATGSRGEENAARILVLDPESLAVQSEYDVGETALYGLAVNNRTQTLYGTATRTGHIVALDLENGEVKGMVGGDRAHVRQLVVDEDSNTIYASVVGSRRETDNPIPSSLWVIDGDAHEITKTIDIPGTLTGLDVDIDAGLAYMTDMNANHVVQVDIDSGDVLNQWPTGGESTINVAVDPEGQRLFVTNQGSGTLTIMNAGNGDVIETIETGEGALSVAYNPDANHIYVTNRRAGTTSVVDAESYEIVSNLTTGTLPQSLAIDWETEVVYVSNKARGLGRNAPADAEPVVDENGDTVNRIIPSH